MMKMTVKKVLVAMLSITMMIGMAGCGGSKSDRAKNSKYSGKELNIYLWPEYIPDEVISDFESKYDVKVNVSTFSSNEEMLSKVKGSAKGTYDIVCPSDYMVQYMIKEHMLAELKKDQLTNLKNMDENYMKQFYDLKNEYSIPLAGGEIIPCYDKTQVKTKITSLNDLFNKEFKNKIVVLDDMRIVIGMTAMSMGYSLNESDSKKLKQVNTKMKTLKDNIYKLTFEATHDMLISGEVPVGYTFNGNVALAEAENENLVHVWPKEGSYIWIDNLCITKNSKNQELANEFINYMMDAEVNKKQVDTYPVTNPNKAGREIATDKVKEMKALDIPAEQLKKSEYAKSVSEDTLKTYSKMWTEFTK